MSTKDSIMCEITFTKGIHGPKNTWYPVGHPKYERVLTWRAVQLLGSSKWKWSQPVWTMDAPTYKAELEKAKRQIVGT